MLKLEQISPKMVVSGLDRSGNAEVVAAVPIGADSLTVYYKTMDGSVHERMLFRTDEESLQVAQAGRPWAFDAPAEDFKLGAEAFRINLAYLFDPMTAVHTSNVEPLPHQITAVYESMLPKQPLRYVLADDPGAGKTIMAGLYMRELLIRADAKRILIIAPGSLVEQWQDEMAEKFGLDFTLFSRELVEQSRSGNPFEDIDLMVARVDQLSRADELLEKLRLSHWDLVIVDEAHKLSASYSGNKIKTTKRFELGRLLGSITRHFLLMTATPHNGKEADFQLFMSLLDSDRFYGKFRDGVHKVDVSDLMRRMVKEELLKFDGTPLFPERKAYTVNYELSDLEKALYFSVTEYVKDEFNKADKLNNERKVNVGFALTSLQRRLASSPAAIYESLKRRHARLSSRLEETKLMQQGQALTDIFDDGKKSTAYFPDDDDSLPADEYEDLEENLVDMATAAQSINELEAELLILKDLEEKAKQVVLSNKDRKWDELSKLLQDRPEMKDATGLQRKLIIFTEHKDTLNYLESKIGNLIGNPNAVAVIHGGVKREERRKIQELFRNDPSVRILIATDAAGEGVNLQNANLMVNYDLPWNPNRLEQRFGRIHRIGQTEVCHLWNMVASQTREGDVFQHLFQKLQVESERLNGRVFDILGEVFEDRSLKDLLIEAIRYGEDPAVKARLYQKVDGALDIKHIEAIISRNALSQDIMRPEDLFAVREKMERAEARRLQPYFIKSFFLNAFEKEGGSIKNREKDRFEISQVPASIRERDRRISGRSRNISPVTRRYERICFEREAIRLIDRPSAPMAVLMHPGHPLMQSLIDITLEKYRKYLKQGAVFVDLNDMGVSPKVILLIDHTIREGNDQNKAISRRIQFVSMDEHGNTANAGWAPYLDYDTLDGNDRELISDQLDAPWISKNLEPVALTYASQAIVPEHYEEVSQRRKTFVDKTMNAVQERLVKEINFWADRRIKLEEDIAVGKDVQRLQLSNAKQRHDEMTARLAARKQELEAMRHVVSSTPVVVGGALVIPKGLLLQRKGEPGWTVDVAAKQKSEMIAMNAVMEIERKRGHKVADVSTENCGWDITSTPVGPDGKLGESRHIEVKGRAKGQTTVTVSRNEILSALNQGEKYILAVVIIDGDSYEGPFYITQPFEKEPDWTTSSVNVDLGKLLSRAELQS